VQECVPLSELSPRRELLSEDCHWKLDAGLEEISRMLSGLINSLDQRER
jgi:hypothetical protein